MAHWICVLSLVAGSAVTAAGATGTAPGKLRLASCQFPVSGDIGANGEWVRKQMRKARALNADVAHFCECALSGYPGTDFKTMEGYDWGRLRKETERVLVPE